MKKVIIIGAGISGLSAGIHLQRNGYKTEIYEMHSLPGGLCTSWSRKNYTIDGCIHWLVGSSPTNNVFNIWNEVIDIQSIKFVDHEEFIRIEERTGKYISVFSNIDKLEEEMFRKAPEDHLVIKEFIKSARKMSKLNLPSEKAWERYNVIDTLKFIWAIVPYMGEFKKWIKISSEEYSKRCKNPLLAKTFTALFHPKMAMLFLLFMMGWFSKKSAGYPIGGSLKLARLLERSYLDSGGEINYNSKVKKIITKTGSLHDETSGILLENGKINDADIVISACDGYTAIYNMLEGKYVNDEIKKYYNSYDVFPSYVQVSLGISRSFEGIASSIVFPIEQPITIDSSISYDHIPARIFNFDPSLAPNGKTVITVMLTTYNFQYWQNLKKQNNQQYLLEKSRIGNAVVDALDKRFGNIKSNMEMIDIATPVTVNRYTNNRNGCFEGWLLTPKIGLKKMKKELPGINNFFMIGQWVEPGGGVGTSVFSGRSVAEIICKRDKIRFNPQRVSIAS